MKHTKLFVAASAIAFAFTTLTPSSATANESNHGLHKKHDHQSTGEGHKGHDHDKGKSAKVKKGFAKKPPVGTKAKCPVMGNEFEVTKDTKFSVYKGKHYAFCCAGCKPAFDKEPEKYVK